MDRRDFLKGSFLLGAGALAMPATARGTSKRAFRMGYAPHLGMFAAIAGHDPIAQLRYMADQGFTAFEDDGMAERPVGLQEAMAVTMRKRGMAMGAFAAIGDRAGTAFASGDEVMRETVLSDMRRAVEVAKRTGAAWCTAALGHQCPGLEWDRQTANTVELLKRCAGLCEQSGLAMLIQPLNRPGTFASTASQACELCRAVGSPSCKVLFDIHHQQVTAGNIISSIDRAWDEIAYFRIGDSPGRKEPSTGEINYRNVVRHIHAKGYAGLLGMAHGNSRPGADGARAVIRAYVALDDI